MIVYYHLKYNNILSNGINEKAYSKLLVLSPNERNMIDATPVFPATIIQTSVAILGIFTAVYVYIKDEQRDLLKWLFKLIFVFSTLCTILNVIWLDLLTTKVLSLSFSRIEVEAIAVSLFLIEITMVSIFAIFMREILTIKRKESEAFKLYEKIATYILVSFTLFVGIILINGFNINVDFLIIYGGLATFVFLKVFTGLHYRLFCKRLVKKNEMGLPLCHRCNGFFFGMFFFLLLYAFISIFNYDIRQIDLPTTYIISGIIVVLNALQGILRRPKYFKVNFFTSDISAFILGLLFGLFVWILGLLLALE